MSKSENSLFSYSVHFTVNLPAWTPKDANVTLMSFLRLFTQHKMKFPADLVTFTEEIFNGKLHFLCCVITPERKTLFQIHKITFVNVKNVIRTEANKPQNILLENIDGKNIA